MTKHEKNLIAACVNDEKAAWDAFVTQYSALIYHTIKKTFALHAGSAPNDSADDLFQEIFLYLVKDDFPQLRRFRGDRGCTLASWLRMIAARRTIDFLRRSKKPAKPLEEPVLDQAGEELESQETKEQLELLMSALPKLQPHEQIIIDLIFRQNLSKNLQRTLKAEALRQGQLEMIGGKQTSDLLVRRGVGGIGRLGEVPEERSPSQDSIRGAISHPYFWAPFILVGSGE